MARRTWWKVGALLAAMMVFLTMLPVTALAADNDKPNNLYVGTTNIAITPYDDNAAYWTSDDGITWTSQTDKPTADSYIHYDGNGTLTLHNVSIQGDYTDYTLGYGIYAMSSSGPVSLSIVLEEKNNVSGMYGINVSSDGGYASLNISGPGSLTVSSPNYNGIGIFMSSKTSDANLTIEGASVTASGNQSGGSGVRLITSQTGSPNLTIAVKGGSLQASGASNGIHFLSNTNDATAVANLQVSGNAMVKASSISTTKDGTGSAPELKPATSGSDGTGGIIWDGKNGTVYGSVTLQEDLTIGEGESLTLDNGASLNAGGHNVIVDGGTLGAGLEEALGDNVKYPPTITTTTLTDGRVGEPYSASLGADGTAPITWSVSGSLPAGLSLNGNTISGTPTTAGTSTFTVTATNGYGAGDSEALSITINPVALSITTQPSNQSVTEGQTASFSVAATGSGTLTYQWQQSTGGSTWTNVDGANAATYTIKNTTTAMSGYQYRCVVTDGNSTEVTSQAATLTVTAATVSVTGVTLNKTSANLTVGGTVILTATITPNNASNKSVTWNSSNPSVATVDADGKVTAVGAGTATITVTTADGNKTATCVVTVTYPYVPPRPTGPDWGDVADDISDAEPGSTVKVDMDGKTVLPGEVLDELAGLDVTLALDMGDGLIWEIYGGDVPADAEYDDVDLGVALGGDDIPADVVNLVTGESGSVQVSLEHDGPFGFELTLVAPLGEDAAGLVANLYRYDDEAGSLGYEATAQVDGEGVARLPFDHASSWLVALDSRTHALPFADASEGEWYSEAIRWAWLGGAMTGYEGTDLFGTGDPLTRAQLAQVLYNRAGAPEVEPADGFADVDGADWFAPAVAWASSEGLLTGYGEGAFGPDDALTREQLAVVFWRMAGESAAEADLSEFPDGDETSAWAVEAMEWAVSTGLLGGYTDTGRLDPTGDFTRAQAATVFFRQAEAATE